MAFSPLPASTTTLRVDLRGAEIVGDGDGEPEQAGPETRDIYLPKHTEFISHIALDIGGSLAKIVYFSRSAIHSGSPAAAASQPNGILTPALLRRQPSRPSSPALAHHIAQSPGAADLPHAPPGGPSQAVSSPLSARASSMSPIPGGRLNFTKFETDAIESQCIPFINNLIQMSAHSNRVPIETMKTGVKVILTGGGAYKYFDLIKSALGGDVEVLREEEMDCLITGLNFLTEIPNEVFWFSDELVQEIVHNRPSNASVPASKVSDSISHSSEQPSISSSTNQPLPRPAPSPPGYSVLFDSNTKPHFPCILVNIGSGVSIIKVTGYSKFERISGTSLGGGTLWGLLSLLTQSKTFDEMLDLSMKGDNSKVDMLVGDIYGQDYDKIGLKSNVIASSFGKVFKKRSSSTHPHRDQDHDESEISQGGSKGRFSGEDISKSLLYAISNNIGQIAHLIAEQQGIDRIYFGGCFIRGHVATVSTLSYAIRFWSKGTKRAFFLRHEGYIGSVGAWLKNLKE